MIQRSIFSLVVGLACVVAAGASAAPGTVPISGKVLDPHGRPAGAATVYVSAYNFTDPFAAWEGKPPVRQATTAADGAFRVEMPASSDRESFYLAAFKPGFGPGLGATWWENRTTG